MTSILHATFYCILCKRVHFQGSRINFKLSLAGEANKVHHCEDYNAQIMQRTLSAVTRLSNTVITILFQYSKYGF